jgi:hypothetical protein
MARYSDYYYNLKMTTGMLWSSLQHLLAWQHMVTKMRKGATDSREAMMTAPIKLPLYTSKRISTMSLLHSCAHFYKTTFNTTTDGIHIIRHLLHHHSLFLLLLDVTLFVLLVCPFGIPFPLFLELLHKQGFPVFHIRRISVRQRPHDATAEFLVLFLGAFFEFSGTTSSLDFAKTNTDVASDTTNVHRIVDDRSWR